MVIFLFSRGKQKEEQQWSLFTEKCQNTYLDHLAYTSYSSFFNEMTGSVDSGPQKCPIMQR